MTPASLFGVSFQNPVLLASGTAGFGREVSGVIALDALGGIVTKAVTPESRRGHPAPRVAEFVGGMLNAVGNRAKSVRVQACLTARPISQADGKPGPSDPRVPYGRAPDQQIKGTLGITG